jgi:16S rRNA (guanine527-N7)-methyltransferase
MLESRAVWVLGRSLESRELELFEKYLLILGKWQRAHRIVGSSDPAWIVENLFLDSLLFLRVLPAQVSSIADLGSGAGFPGIPIKIVRPDLDAMLIESRQRRASFLSAVIRELGLTNIRVLADRAEKLPGRLSKSPDAVVARCAGNIQGVLPLAASLVKPGGIIILSGSPTRRPLELGTWLEVAGSSPGSTRSFVVLRS